MAIRQHESATVDVKSAPPNRQPVRVRLTWRALLLAALSGVLQVLIFPSAGWSALSWIAVAPLLVAIFQARDGQSRIANLRQGLLLGYITGLIWSAGCCYWIYHVMHLYGGLSAPIAAGVLLLFTLAMAVSFAVFGFLVSLIAAGRLREKALLVAPFVWVATEMLRGFPFDFRWNPLGTVLVDNIPVSRLATVTGVYGLSCEIMFVNVAFAAAVLLEKQRRRVLLVSAIVLTAALQAGTLLKPPKLPANGTARLIQANVPILTGDEWTPQYFQQTVRELTELSVPKPGELDPNQPPIDLIVWPETPAPFFISDINFRRSISEIARQTHATVVVGSLGLPTPQQGEQLYNSAAVVGPDGAWGARYDKIHLVPFGEYVPFQQLFSFASSLTHEVGAFIPGRERNVLRGGDLALGVFICYESIFPNEIREFAANGARVFVNISNDGWFGDTAAPYQHLQQARMRSIENRRWLLRSTNTGVTGVIDPFGRVLDTAPRHQRTYIDVPFSEVSETTFYARHGNWFVWLCAIISAVAVASRFLLAARA